MTDWAGGYVADIEYITGFYRPQAPAHLTLAGLLGGVDSRLPMQTDAAHYLELGCGRGMNAALMAASNPGWQVTAVDYNPAHIAAGRSLANQAGLDNITFIEADFAALAERDMRPADVVSMHGVWSWVSPAVRAGIVRLLNRVVAPGGLVHLSYNALPAWQGGIGLQRLVFEAGRRSPGRSDRQVTAGLAFAGELKDASARYLMDPLASDLVARLGEAAVGYLAHEYMNAHWSPCFHADVAAALSDAKLDWAASGNLLESFPDLMLSDTQRGLLNRYEDPIMRELVKDICMPRQLRHDLFVRGARRLTNEQRDAVLRELFVVMSVPADDFVFAIDVPAGQAEMGPAFRHFVKALRDGPMRVADLLATAPGHSNPAELAAVLVGTNQALIVPRPGTPPSTEAIRFNRTLGAQITSLAGPEPSGGLASTALGTGLPATRAMQFVCGRILAGEGEADLDTWFQDLRHDIPEEKHETLHRILHDVVDNRLGPMRQAGVLPG